MPWFIKLCLLCLPQWVQWILLPEERYLCTQPGTRMRVCVCVCVCMCVCVCVCSLTQTMGPTTPCTLLRMKSPMTMVNPFATNGSNHWILHQLNRSIKLIHGQGTKVLFAATSDCLQQLVHFKQTYVHCVFHICSL